MNNVIFFVTSLQSGGIENYLLRFLQNDNIKFDNIYIYCKSGYGGQLEQDYLRISNLKIIKNKIGYFDIGSFKSLKSFLLKENINAVCDFTGNFAGVILSIAKSVGIKIRISFYRGSTDHFKKDYFRNLYNNFVKNLVLKNATRILSNSTSAFNYFYPNIWEKDTRFEVIYNGINSNDFINEKGTLREELGIPHNAFVVGHIGRYNKAKNHVTIIKVAEELTKLYSDIYFILCGNGVKQNIGNKLSASELEEERILLFENRNDIPRVLKTMDCFYFPSITEGQPNALIEALVVGLPFVASNIDPIKETIPFKYHRQLIDPLDVKSAVSKILDIKNKITEIDFSNLSSEIIYMYDANELFGKFYRCF